MIMPPTSTMPWIELAPDMSGVCSVAGTLLMTSNPTRTARMKMTSEPSRLISPFMRHHLLDSSLAVASCTT